LNLAALALADGQHDAERLVAVARQRIETEPRARLEYLSVVDRATLDPITEVRRPAVVLAAVWFGDVRLIDNLQLSP
jgi:pantoate--beta-alanine ligase